jgi:ABC-type transport system involved in multi-copper enzyme maturation permease subunit
MIQYLRADIYRLIRTKGLYVALALLAAISVLNSLMSHGNIFSFGQVDSEQFSKLTKKYIITEDMAYDFFSYDNRKNDYVSYNVLQNLHSVAVVGDYTDDDIKEQYKDFPKYIPIFIDRVHLYKDIYASLNIPEDEATKLFYEPNWDEQGNLRDTEGNIIPTEKVDEYINARRYDWVEWGPIAANYVAKINPKYAYALLTERTEYDLMEEYGETIYFPSAASDEFYGMADTYGSAAPFKALYGGSVIMYFILAAVGMLFMEEFANSTFKNSLSSGYSRLTAFASKFVGIFCLSIIFYLVYVAFNVLFATVLNGFNGFNGGGNNVGVWFIGLASQLPMLFFYASFAILLCCFFRKPAGLNVTFILFFLVEFVVLEIITVLTYVDKYDENGNFISQDMMWLTKYDFNYMMSEAASAIIVKSGELARITVLPFALGVACLIGAFTVFKRTEIK